ncbi:MAG: hypothetical protein IT458_20765 [Planctomycetes bacterium]|nr:hypothetical protein [Planctomycetota bacterium]
MRRILPALGLLVVACVRVPAPVAPAPAQATAGAWRDFAWTVARVGPRARIHEAELRHLLGTPDCAALAAHALGSLGAVEEATEAALARSLRATEPAVRAAALAALLRLVPEHRRRAEWVAAARVDPDQLVRQVARGAR